MSEAFVRNSSITISDTTVSPGERVAISLPIAGLYTGSLEEFTATDVP